MGQQTGRVKEARRDHRAGTLRGSAIVVALSALTIGIAGCSDTAANLLSTGSLTAPAATEAKPVTPTDRMLQVAALSARAQKCGYAFNPADLRANFIASETAGGLAPDQIAALGTQYDYTQRTIAAKIVGETNYCSPDRLTIIKADLNRYLTGDFSTRVAKRGIQRGWLESDTTTKTVLNPEFGRFPDAAATVERKTDE